MPQLCKQKELLWQCYHRSWGNITTSLLISTDVPWPNMGVPSLQIQCQTNNLFLPVEEHQQSRAVSLWCGKCHILPCPFSIVSSCNNRSSTASLPAYHLLSVEHAFGCLPAIWWIFLHVLDALNITQAATEPAHGHRAPYGASILWGCFMSVSLKGKVILLSLLPESILAVITDSGTPRQSQPLHLFAPRLPHMPTEMSFGDHSTSLCGRAGENKHLDFSLLVPFMTFRCGWERELCWCPGGLQCPKLGSLVRVLREPCNREK